MNFTNSKIKFYKAVESENERVKYCKTVYEIDGLRGRNKEPKEADYTPNANYRSLLL